MQQIIYIQFILAIKALNNNSLFYHPSALPAGFLTTS